MTKNVGNRLSDIFLLITEIFLINGSSIWRRLLLEPGFPRLRPQPGVQRHHLVEHRLSLTRRPEPTGRRARPAG